MTLPSERGAGRRKGEELRECKRLRNKPRRPSNLTAGQIGAEEERKEEKKALTLSERYGIYATYPWHHLQKGEAANFEEICLRCSGIGVSFHIVFVGAHMTSAFDWECCCHLAILTQIEIQARLIDLAAVQNDSSEIAQIKDALKTLDVLDRRIPYPVCFRDLV